VKAKPLAGRVVVVAGDADTVGPIASALYDAGAAVALVALADAARLNVTVHMRADPSRADVWDRVTMHVEQHLGPVDAAVADDSAALAMTAALAGDLERRGHGGVVVVRAGDDVDVVVSRVVGTQ
jgi:hypothetical protein